MASEQDKSINYRLKGSVIAGMVFFAIVADLVTLIPFVGVVVGPLYWILLSIFLYKKGFGIINARRLATSIGSMVVEMVPVLQALPLITVGTILIIVLSKMEDRLGIKIPTKGSQPPGATIDPNTQPLNRGGVRPPNQQDNQKPLNANGARQPVNPAKDTPPPESVKRDKADDYRRDTSADVYGQEVNKVYGELKQAGWSDKDAHKMASASAKSKADMHKSTYS